MVMLRRIFYHSMRFRGEFIFSSIFSAIFTLFFSGFYPEETIGGFVEIIQSVGLMGNLSKNAPGWSIWMSIMISMTMYIVIAVTAINIGSRVIPTKEEDGSEFFMGSNPMDARQFYLENVFAGVLVIVAMMIPSYLIVVFQTWKHDASDIIGEITLVFLAFLIMAYLFIAATSAVSASLFQKGLAKGLGFGYMFYAFIVELFADIPDLKDAAKLSVNYYANVTSLLLDDHYDWNPLLIILFIAIVFTFIGFLFVKSPHYIEKAGSKERFSIVDATIGRVVTPQSFLGRRFPLFTEQLRRDKKALFIVFIIFTIYFPILISSFRVLGEDLIPLMAGFNTPSTAILIQGNELEPSLLGFGIMKFYSAGWMWFGIYSMYVAASIPTREVRTRSQDIIYGTSVKPEKLMNNRLIAMLVEFTFIVWYGFWLMTTLVLNSSQAFQDDYATYQEQFNFFLITWIHYSAIFIMMVGIAMLPREVGKGRRNAIGFFVASLVINMIAYVNESIEFIKYFSIFNYYNPIPILYGETEIITDILVSGLILVISVVFYFGALKYRYRDSSLY